MNRNEKIYKMADFYLASMSDEYIRFSCPADYPEKICDDHRLTVWNSLVDSFTSYTDEELEDFHAHMFDPETDFTKFTAAAHALEKAIVEGFMGEQSNIILLNFDEGTAEVLDEDFDFVEDLEDTPTYH